MSAVEFNMLYSIYSLPNLVAPILGGILMDKFGARFLVYLSSILVTAGHAIFAFGVSIGSFPIALLGRGIFGCGGDNLDLSQSVIVIGWFASKELSMAFGLNSTISMLGEVANDILEPVIIREANMNTALWVGFLVCVGSLLSAIIVNTMDSRRDKLIGKLKFSERPESEKFKFKDIKKLNLMFWILLLNCLSVDTSVYCFEYIASGFFQYRFGYDYVEAGSIMSLTFMIAAFFCPLIGYIADRIGKRVIFIIVSAIFGAMFHVLCLLSPDSDRPIYPIFFLALLGLSYSIYVTTYWSALSYIVDAHLYGTAFGTVYAISNLGLVIFPPFIGYIQDNSSSSHGYFWVSFLLAVVGFIGVVTGFIVYFLDMKNGGILDAVDPYKARAAYEAKMAGSQPSFDGLVN